MYPRQHTGTFKVLECLFNGGKNIDEIIDSVGYVTHEKRRSRMLSLLASMERRGYVSKHKDVFSLTHELHAYVDEVLETMGKIPKKDLVLPPYKNAFTPEMKNYNLLANKRGYF